jgi:hypothetical protein
MGFLWRFYYLRWDVFRRKYYILAIFLFLAIVGIWAVRNIMLFGFPNWETSYWVKNATDYSMAHPLQYLKMVFLSTVTFIILFSAVAIFFTRELKASLKRVKEEHYSGLWLAVFIVFFIGIFISGAFAMVEAINVFTSDRIRYVIVGMVPLSWLIVKDTDFQVEGKLKWLRSGDILQCVKNTLSNTPLITIIFLSLALGFTYLFLLEYLTFYLLVLIVGIICLMVKGSRKRLLLLLLLFLLLSINTITEVRYSGAESIGRDLKNHVGANDTVALYTLNKYDIYPYIENIDFKVIIFSPDCGADWIVSDRRIIDNNYTLHREYKNHNRQGVLMLAKYLIQSGQSMDEYLERDPDYFLYKYEFMDYER